MTGRGLISSVIILGLALIVLGIALYRKGGDPRGKQAAEKAPDAWQRGQTLLTHVCNAVWGALDLIIGGAFRFIERHSVSRHVTLWFSVYATFDSYVWAKHFAETTTKSGLEVPGIITAVLAAVTGLQGWVLKLYLDGRKDDQKGS